jgi:hypothetical protein
MKLIIILQLLFGSACAPAFAESEAFDLAKGLRSKTVKTQTVAIDNFECYGLLNNDKSNDVHQVKFEVASYDK